MYAATLLQGHRFSRCLLAPLLFTYLKPMHTNQMRNRSTFKQVKMLQYLLYLELYLRYISAEGSVGKSYFLLLPSFISLRVTVSIWLAVSLMRHVKRQCLMTFRCFCHRSAHSRSLYLRCSYFRFFFFLIFIPRANAFEQHKWVLHLPDTYTYYDCIWYCYILVFCWQCRRGVKLKGGSKLSFQELLF